MKIRTIKIQGLSPWKMITNNKKLAVWVTTAGADNVLQLASRNIRDFCVSLILLIKVI